MYYLLNLTLMLIVGLYFLMTNLFLKSTLFKRLIVKRRNRKYVTVAISLLGYIMIPIASVAGVLFGINLGNFLLQSF